MELLSQWDINLFQLINTTWTNSYFDSFFVFISDASRNPWIRFGIVPLLVMWWAFFKRKEALRGFLSMVLVVSACDLMGHRVIKPIFERPRPFLVESNQSIMRLEKPAGGFSFPSNHAANCFGGATVLAWFLPAAAPVAFIYATLVAYSRPYVGVHYPSDILGGAVLGILIGFIFILLCKKFFPQWGPRRKTESDIK